MSVARRTLVVIATALPLTLLIPTSALALAPGDDSPGFTAVRTHLAGGSGEESVTDVVVQPDGRIVASLLDDAEVDRRIVRLLPDGSLDQSFAVGGTWHMPRDSATYVRALALAPDGSIVFAGEDATRPAIVVGRLTPDGWLDPTFAGDGLHVSVTDPGSAPIVQDVVVQPNGRIAFAGVISAPPKGDELLIGRLLASGADDPDFTGTPFRTFGSPYDGEGDSFGGMALMANGDFIVGDNRQLDGPIIWRIGPNGQYFVAANVDLPSTLDTPMDVAAADATHVMVLLAGHGSAGLAYLDVSATPRVLPAATADGVARPFPPTFTGHQLLRTSDGRYLVAGIDSTGTWHRAIARLQADGALDSSFGAGGVRHLDGTSTAGFYLATQSIATTGDGSIVSGFHVLGDGVRMSAIDRIVGRVARVRVAVEAPTDPVELEATTEFQLHLFNDGPDASGPGSTSFTVADGLRVMSVNGPACTASSGGGTCRFGDLAPGAGRQVIVRVRASAAGTRGVSARIGATTFDDQVGDDSASSSGTFVVPKSAAATVAAPAAPIRARTLRLTLQRITGYQGRVLRGCGSARHACRVTRVSKRGRVRPLFLRASARPVPASQRRRVVLLMQQRIGRRWVTRHRPRLLVGASGAADARMPTQWRTRSSLWRMRAQTIVPRGRRPVTSNWLLFRVR